MTYPHLLLALCAALAVGGCSSSSAGSASGTSQDAGQDIGIITRPTTDAPQCMEPVQPNPRQDSDIGIISKPATTAPQCMEPAQPSRERADVVPRGAPADSELEPGPSPCPVGMVAMGDTTCVDRFEASRPDATAVAQGRDSSQATSRAGVLPWFPVDIATARAACAAAGKRLCKEGEIRSACQGPAATAYAYGNTYAPATCNGIDTYGSALRVMPTGSFPGCVNEYGAFDLSGNVWELVDRGTNQSWYMGGAFNCIDSKALHRCDSLVQNVSARGFRCCADQEAVP